MEDDKYAQGHFGQIVGHGGRFETSQWLVVTICHFCLVPALIRLLVLQRNGGAGKPPREKS